MQTTLDCMACFVRQALDAARMVTDNNEDTERVLRDVLWEMSQMSMHQSPVVMAQRVHRLVRQLGGDVDPYRELKDRCNLMALEFHPQLKDRVLESDTPLEMALRLAIAGNAIDVCVGAGVDIQREDLNETIRHALGAPFSGNIDSLEKAISRAKTILYLADNAGEIVFDQPLIELMSPARVTVAVRGEPVLNDATMFDAESTGLTELVEVIDNGSDAPGTLLDDCSEAFRRRFDEADVVIAKGQGNYESLNDAYREVFLVLKAKCPVIAAQLGCPVSSLVVKRAGAGQGDDVGVDTNEIQQNLRDTSVDTALPRAEIRST